MDRLHSNTQTNTLNTLKHSNMTTTSTNVSGEYCEGVAAGIAGLAASTTAMVTGVVTAVVSVAAAAVITVASLAVAAVAIVVAGVSAAVVEIGGTAKTFVCGYECNSSSKK